MTGDLEAFNELVLVYQDLAYHHAYALLGDPDLAEDAAQESFIKAFQNISGFRGGSFRSWLLKIVTNSAYDVLRRAGRHPLQPLFPVDENGEEVESAPWLADPAPGVQATVEQHELSKEIYRVLDGLPDAYRSVITLVDLYELDYTEAAQALKVPLGTVKSRLARARMEMQKRLKDSVGYNRGLTDGAASLARDRSPSQPL
jgi:RNA polymerase sigma-70 factor (ECF subfamily)